MFWPSTIELSQFYKTPLGQKLVQVLIQKFTKIWPVPKNEQIVGLGYCSPILDYYYQQESSNDYVMATIPEMGVSYWPYAEVNNRTILVAEDELPIKSESVNRLMMMHCLEFCHNIDYVLQEAYRVLVPGGRAILVIPHRLSMWSRFEHTPFGFGHPFHIRHIKRIIRRTHFVPTHTETALLFPPINSQLFLKTALTIEKIGAALLSNFGGGVVIIEVEKQLYALSQEYRGSRQMRKLSVVSKPAVGIQSPLD